MFRTNAGNGSGIRPLDGRARGAIALLLLATGCTGEPAPRPTDPPAPPRTDIELCSNTQTCLAFPSEPIAQGPIPVDAESLFQGAPDVMEGVCLIEPQDGALFPRDALPPRFRFRPLPGENLWQITLNAPSETHALHVYTTRPQWTMGTEMWHNLRTHVDGEEAVSVTVRGTSPDGVLSETSAKFGIAPVEAGGTIVYWAADGAYELGGETKLVGFQFGDPRTVDTLRPEQVEEVTLASNAQLKLEVDEPPELKGRVTCIGCHASTPDHDAVAFADRWPWNSVVASIATGSVGKRPSYVTQAAGRVLQQPWQGAPAFSTRWWSTTGGKKYMLQSFGGEVPGWPNSDLSFNDTGRDRLIWFDLAFQEKELPESAPELQNEVLVEGGAFGFIARNGDEDRGAVNPAWSHDGETIAYVSASQTLDGHVGGSFAAPVDPADPPAQVEADIRLVPFNDGQGGDSILLKDASDPNFVEYYPDYSADDAWIAFNRAPESDEPAYYRPDGEIYIVKADGSGSLTRLAANSPPACTDQDSPGIINSWPKWSPTVLPTESKTYYWLIFSSARAYVGQFTLPKDDFSPDDTRSSQLYLAAVVVGKDGTVQTYPAIYLYNQTTNTTNLTPAWDELQLPEVE